MSVKFDLPCIQCWDDGAAAGTVTELPGYPDEFLALPPATRAEMTLKALCPKHKHLEPELRTRVIR